MSKSSVLFVEKSRALAAASQPSDADLLDRYLVKRDEDAFATLVRRHSAKVWSVCRRVLRCEQDAENALQAVVLLLARKAGSIHHREAVGSWLYGVAYRVAMRARKEIMDRQKLEQRGSSPKGFDSPLEAASLREVHEILDEELRYLGDKYRSVIVHCCMEGLSQADAARVLGWTVGTVSGRLHRARQLLQRRLARRGVSLATALLALSLGQSMAAASAPTAIVSTTVAAALAGNAVQGVSPAALSLANSLTRTVVLAKLKGFTALAVAVFACALGAMWTANALSSQVPPQMVKPDLRKADAVFRLPPIPLVKPSIDERVLGVAFTSDGKRLITAGARDRQPGQVTVWDPANGQALAQERGIRGTRGIALSPDDKTLACGEFGGVIRLRDPNTGKEVGTLKGHNVGVNSVAFSADGSRLASAGLDRIVKIWDMKSRSAIKTLSGHKGMVFSVAFFQSGQAVVSSGDDKTAIVWDLATGSPKFTFQLDSGVETVAVSPDDKFVVTGSWDGKIRLWDAATGNEVGSFPHDRSGVYALAFSPDGQTLAAGGTNNTVRLYDVAKRQPYAAQGWHAGPVWALAFSPDGTTLASGSEDKMASLWDVAALKRSSDKTETPPEITRPRRTLDTREFKGIVALALSPEGSEVATITSDGHVQVRDSLTGAMRTQIHGRPRIRLAYAPDKPLLALSDDQGTIRLCDTSTGKDLHVFKSEGGVAMAVALSPDGKWLAAGNVNQKIYLWEAANPAKLQVLEGHKSIIMSLAFAPDSRGLASGDQSGTLKTWDIKSGQETASQEAHPGGPCVVAYASTGVLASAGIDGIINLWQAPLTMLRTIKGPDAVSALTFSRDGKLLVSGTYNATLIAWYPDSGELLQKINAFPSGIASLGMDARDGSLLSGGPDGGLLRWQAIKSELPVPVTDTLDKVMAAPTGDLYHDFRGAKPLPGFFKVQNFDNQATLTSEKEGLRIALPAARQRVDRVGLKLSTNLAGDFEVTVGFEILHAAQPSKGNGVGFNMILAREGAGESVSFERNKRVQGDDVLLSTHQTTNTEGKAQWQTKQKPSTMTSGQLRMLRIGDEVTYWAAQGNSNSFRKVDIDQYCAAAINTIFLAAYPGFAQNAVDVRIKDLRVRQTAVAAPTNVAGIQDGTGVTDTVESADAKGPGAFYQRRWSVLSMVILVLILCSSGCVWIVRRRQTREEVVAKPPSPVIVACVQCKQKLKVRTELLGKKVKCPRCGRAVLVTTT